MDAVLDALANYGVELLVSIITPILIILMNKLLRLARNKIGLEVDKEQQKKLEKLLKEGIQYAEEQARKAAKGKETNLDEITSEQKMDAAISYIKKNADSLGLKGLVEDQRDVLINKVESKLFDMRSKESDKPKDQ
jgi:hypothetical protein